jgi:hypothetical protein
VRHVSRTDPRVGKRLDWRRRGGSWTGREAYRNRATQSQHSTLTVGDDITDNRLDNGLTARHSTDVIRETTSGGAIA